MSLETYITILVAFGISLPSPPPTAESQRPQRGSGLNFTSQDYLQIYHFLLCCCRSFSPATLCHVCVPYVVLVQGTWGLQEWYHGSPWDRRAQILRLEMVRRFPRTTFSVRQFLPWKCGLVATALELQIVPRLVWYSLSVNVLLPVQNIHGSFVRSRCKDSSL